jgi:DNA-binding NarL/FixJ family response regulator
MQRSLLIVDDHEAFRNFVSALLDGDEFAVAGVAGDGESALDAVESLRPDFVLLDVQLPGIDGFEVAQLLASRPDPPGVVLTSTRDAADFGARLRDAPVIGFVPKHEMSVEAISALVDGRPGRDHAA